MGFLLTFKTIQNFKFTNLKMKQNLLSAILIDIKLYTMGLNIQ